MAFGNRSGWLEKLAKTNPSVVAPLPGEQPPPRKPNAAKKSPGEPKPARLGRQQQPEHVQQVACFVWARAKYPWLDKLLYAVPNGGFRHKATADKLKREGVTTGVSDITLAVARGGFAGLYLENKFGRNDTSDAQDDFLDQVLAQGYQTAVFWTQEQFQQIIDDYLAQPPTLLGLVVSS
jgi:hypothetical protein